MARQGNRLTPARNIPPGAIIKDELDARDWTQDDLARIMGRPVQVISEIVSGKKQITPETALGLAAAFGTSAEMWLNMEATYRLCIAQQRSVNDVVERRSRIYSVVPVKELVKRGWIPEATDVEDVDQLECFVTEFLGASSLDDVSDFALAARRTPTKELDSRGVRAWMCRVEQLAMGQEVGAFDRSRLKETIVDVLSFSVEPGHIREVPRILSDLGIHFVVVPHLQKTFLDGAVFAGKGNPIVALTLRYDRLDNLWFTLTHELAHLVLGHSGNRPEDLDTSAGNDPEEQEADQLAAEWLVPAKLLEAFVDRIKPYFSRSAIESFAGSIGRHPAIVLGRLQHDGHVSPAHLRSFVPKVRRYLEPWVDVPAPIYDVSGSISVASEPSTQYDVEVEILGWLRGNPGLRSPGEIIRECNLDRAIWNRAIRRLVDDGRVERTGEKRGTRYGIRDME